mgnify:CR=1 FL=1
MFLDDLWDALSSAGATSGGFEMFKTLMPDSPDQVIALFETGGGPPVHAMNAGPGTAVVERPHVAVWTRAAIPTTARKKAQDVFFSLDALGDKTINGVRYLSVFALQSPFLLQRDETSRPIYVTNFEVVREPATSS